jgi:uncharacterized damage-inducible protein DinB
MNTEQVRFLYAYDRWATQRVLALLDGIDQELWARPNAVGDMSLGAVLVHHLGAAQRWRTAFSSQGSERGPSPEEEPLLSVAELRSRWQAEWAAVDAWLASVSDDLPAVQFEGIPVWQMISHVTNHGTQHRAEAAALLTASGRSPGELDMINFSDELLEQSRQSG